MLEYITNIINDMKLKIENPRKVIGNYQDYVINGVREEPNQYEFRVATLVKYPDGIVCEDWEADVTLFRNIAQDMDGNPVCSIAGPNGLTRYVGVDYISKLENAINTIISEYKRRI